MNYFPVRIKLLDTDELVIINDSADLPQGVPFVVVNLNVGTRMERPPANHLRMVVA